MSNQKTIKQIVEDWTEEQKAFAILANAAAELIAKKLSESSTIERIVSKGEAAK